MVDIDAFWLMRDILGSINTWGLKGGRLTLGKSN